MFLHICPVLQGRKIYEYSDIAVLHNTIERIISYMAGIETLWTISNHLHHYMSEITLPSSDITMLYYINGASRNITPRAQYHHQLHLR
jgi:hypothetical protein